MNDRSVPDALLSPPDIACCRLDPVRLEALFADIHPALSPDQAAIAAARCYFCHDAPCIAACPTGIDIPGFIRGIATGNLTGAGQRILKSNILGGSCARVCPTEILCEGACVRTAQEQQPVAIGALQRVATDHAMRAPQSFKRAPATGRHVAIVGAGPAGLACAHALALRGHAVTLFEARDKPGGLNEYGIAAYKLTDDFAAREIAFVLGIGGITLKTGQRLGRDIHLPTLRQTHDAVFIALGQAGVKALALPGEDLPQVIDAVDFIAGLRQSHPAAVPIGRRVVVIGGGNTAIDAATQAKRLGAELVTIVYRRDRAAMGATGAEQDWALTNGVALRLWATPVAFEGEGALRAVRFARTALDPAGTLHALADHFTIEADMVLKAVGQTLVAGDATGPALYANRILIDPLTHATSLPGVFAGGDCVAGTDLTVRAVQDGKCAAAAIDRFLDQGAHHG
ncbi:MAG: dihydropyrimidine dehydrogenase [Acidiphilium sp. 37-64-53]|uniref:NAD(P)-dependent oxidoreductase n=1 Tax=Acidiphilium TaxID=522 RepID=UPI000BCF4C94|nr:MULTISPECIES: NAD(P)-dependent oxidoreductase [Acidiphilium]OYW02433.1 MAG: dihydropyrimidine dehydrogenase [Acidiphilium sp. 37-64-53]OZB30220.1 MAG: dihydropyrimidine dehydrogenase [Acidiphilium sp. 34-64-41]HQT84382.1 NAD(P)-dependent oxidoreductase [Acidiphilium rubrum]